MPWHEACHHFNHLSTVSRMQTKHISVHSHCNAQTVETLQDRDGSCKKKPQLQVSCLVIGINAKLTVTSQYFDNEKNKHNTSAVLVSRFVVSVLVLQISRRTVLTEF